MTTKLHRHFDIDGNELEPTYIELTPEEVATMEERAACEEYLKQPTKRITQPQTQYLLRVFAKRLGYIKE